MSRSADEVARFYASLPTKRMGAGVVCRDGQGRVLLVRPTYKTTWEVPGGVVEADESPAAAASREVREELGVELSIGRLLVVDWLPPRPPKTEGLMFLFDGGILDEGITRQFALPEAELQEWAFTEPERLGELLTASLAARVLVALDCLHDGQTRYLDAGIGAEGIGLGQA